MLACVSSFPWTFLPCLILADLNRGLTGLGKSYWHSLQQLEESLPCFLHIRISSEVSSPVCLVASAAVAFVGSDLDCRASWDTNSLKKIFCLKSFFIFFSVACLFLIVAPLLPAVEWPENCGDIPLAFRKMNFRKHVLIGSNWNIFLSLYRQHIFNFIWTSC